MKQQRQAKNKKNAKPTGGMDAQKKFYIGLGVIVLTYLIIFAYTYSPKLEHHIVDNVYYYVTGSCMEQGLGFINGDIQQTILGNYPPGYPAVIAVVRAFGGEIPALNVINGLFLLFSLVMLYYLFYEITDKNFFLSFVTVMMLTTNPSITHFANTGRAELSCMFFTMICFCFFYKLLQQKQFNRNYFLILLAVSISATIVYFTKFQAAIIYPTLFLSIICIIIANTRNKNNEQTRPSNKLYIASFVGILVIFIASYYPWAQYLENRKDLIPPTWEGFPTGGNSLTTKMDGKLMEDKYDINEWVIRFENNATIFFTKSLQSIILPMPFFIHLTPNFNDPWVASDWFVGILLFLIVLLGFFTLCRKSQLYYLIFFFIAGTICVNMLFSDRWIHNDFHRYTFGMHPFIILLFIAGLMKTISFIVAKLKVSDATQKFAPYGVVAVFLLYLASNYFPAIAEAHNYAEKPAFGAYKDFPGFSDEDMVPFQEYLQAIQWVDQNIYSKNPDAIVATRKPDIYYTYCNHRPSNFPAMGTEPDSVYNYFKKYKVNYVILDTWYAHAYSTEAPAAMKYPDNFKIIHQLGNPEKPTYILEFIPD
ncbi:MAG: phospholipid carrier-dependent glycosyltransferase [Ignavibacteria bacterium]|jgi:hypothetical protein|nr:phospholipid carrier-dependent glycosyltransferase [Ignavibacteria bacterium]